MTPLFVNVLNYIVVALNNGVSVMSTIFGSFGLPLVAIFACMLSFVLFKNYVFGGFVK